MTASDVSRKLGKHVTTVTEHLDLLVKEGFIERHETPGEKFVFYSLTDKGDQLVRFNGAVIILFVLGILLVGGIIFGGSFLWMTKFQSMIGQQMNTQLSDQQRCQLVTLAVDDVWFDFENYTVHFTLRNAGSVNLKSSEWQAITVSGGVSGKDSFFAHSLRDASVTETLTDGEWCGVRSLSSEDHFNAQTTQVVTCQGFIEEGYLVEETDMYTVTVQPGCGTGAQESVNYTNQE